MLAAISDYFFWWQGVILAVFLMLWLFGGWPLLWVGGRFIARARRATLGTSLVARLLAGVVGFGLAVLLPVGLGALLGPAGAVAGALLGLPAGLLLGWLAIKAVFATSYGRAILAWLPTLGVWVLALPLWITLLMPILSRGREMARRSMVCRANLASVHQAVLMYASENDDQMPPDLGILVQFRWLASEDVKCPSATSGRRYDYFYLPAGPDDPGQRIVACDYRDNHRGRRSVLFVRGGVRWMTEAEFQAELAKPHNAAFAEALRAAEALPTGPAVPRSRAAAAAPLTRELIEPRTCLPQAGSTKGTKKIIAPRRCWESLPAGCPDGGRSAVRSGAARSRRLTAARVVPGAPHPRQSASQWTSPNRGGVGVGLQRMVAPRGPWGRPGRWHLGRGAPRVKSAGAHTAAVPPAHRARP